MFLNIARQLDEKKAKPFVIWAGGKRSIIKELEARLPKLYNNYYEPFIGGGALFFHLSPKNATISDKNFDLMTTYSVIKNKPQELIALLENLKNNHSKEHYYKIRKQFNNDKDNDIEVAARFIYLNRTCFNGVYSVNSKGEFNNSIGYYKNNLILEKDNILACSKALQEVIIKNQCYSAITPKKGDFVYLDPPYYTINNRSSIKYTKLDFKEANQIELCEFCKNLHSQGVYFMLSNSDSQFIKNLYNNFIIEIINAPRNINGGKIVKDVLIRNYK